MSHDCVLQTWPTNLAPSFAGDDARSPLPLAPLVVPVLIQVPAVRPGRRDLRLARRPSERATVRARAGASTRERRRPRRRLRKGVRVTAYAVLLALAFVPAALGFRAGVGAATMAGDDRPARDVTVRPPTVSLTIEGAPLAPAVETGAPVVLPGYLLPEDRLEEPAHAGG